MKLKAGATLGRYRIVEELGRGGMGAVYKAYQPSLDRFVAIKVLPAFFAEDERLRARFKREAVTIAQLDHPAILPVYEYGEKGLRPYIVMALAEGGTLGALPEQPHSVEAAVKLLAPLADALDYAHQRGVLHRDVKPANVLLRKDGRPLLSDFGLARSVDSDTRLTQSGTALGTPEYMAPELWRGDPAGPSSDQYSLAVMCHELLTGGSPFPPSTTGSPQAANIVRQPDLSLAPAGARPALERALSKSPRDRFPICADFVQALLVRPAPPLRRRSTRVLALGIAVALALLVVAAMLVMRPPGPVTRSVLRSGPLTASVVPNLVGPMALKSPSAIAVGADGSLYIADTGNNLIKKVDPTGKVSVLAGGGVLGMVADAYGDPTLVALSSPRGVAVDSSGTVFISDTGRNRIAIVDSKGVRVFAGNGAAGATGDFGAATDAELNAPTSISVSEGTDASGPIESLWIVDAGNRVIRRVQTGRIDTSPLTGCRVAPVGVLGSCPLPDMYPLPINIDQAAGVSHSPLRGSYSVYLSSPASNQVWESRWATQAGGGSVIAGTGDAGYSGDGAAGPDTKLNHPTGIAVDARSNVYIADTGNNRVRLVDHGGTITTIAGGGTVANASKPDQIQLNAPTAVALGKDGSIYILDAGNNRILKLSH